MTRDCVRTGIVALAIGVLLSLAGAAAQAQTIRVGSKNFAEQYTVANIYAEALEDAGFKVERRINLGATAIAHGALTAGQIDLYPEYTGTVLAAVVKQPATADAKDVYDRVKRFYEDKLGLTLLNPTAVDNTYVIVVRPETAKKYNLTTLTSLAPVAGRMVIGAPGEFAVRSDGIPALRRVYGIRFKALKGFAEMRLRYEALMAGDLEVIDAYGTDWQIAQYRLVVLADDKHIFPPYQLVPMVRQDALKAHPGMAAVLNRVAPFITNEKMREMNAAVERDRREPAEVAHQFLLDNGLLKGGVPGVRAAGGAEAAACGAKPLCWTLTHGPEIATAVVQHLYLAVTSVVIALAVALVLGVVSARRPRLYALFLTIATAIFVVPTLALFALLIPLMGLGVGPALVGLSAYCFLILLRNVVVGLRSVPPEVLDAATGLGFDGWRRRVRIELPLA
ncbi:MAG TPA: glycine betaine ABC transporter substrate-binding protein, partial [Caulobacteraceae bacterium]|nr:glycine betaine ABC transporter substrate-binding protein [Caulobacteraceae bacterium]